MEKNMTTLLSILKLVAVLVAALLIGNWFLAEVRKARSQRKPWYQPYLSIPGVLIVLALLLPVIIWIINK
jgi:hypothetical protein